MRRHLLLASAVAREIGAFVEISPSFVMTLVGKLVVDGAPSWQWVLLFMAFILTGVEV